MVEHNKIFALFREHNFTNMIKKEFCIAAARLIYDIIGADGYVSDRELDIMEGSLNNKYCLNDPSRAVEVNKTTFCDALKTLKEWDEKKDVDELINELKLIAGVGKTHSKDQKYSIIEGHCSLSEAWLLLAIEYAIYEDATAFSVKKNDYRFARSEIIYMENSGDNISVYNEMSERYEEYKAQLELYGMHLIYIPKVCSYLKQKREHRKLKLLMRYVSPFHRYEDQDAQKIVDNIDKITTNEFAKDIFSQEARLYNKLRPSLMLKVSTSVVTDDKTNKPQRKSNFILIPIENSVGETLRKALNKYQEYTLDLHIPERKLHGRPFRLHGFDRTFLNFVMSHVLNTEKLTKIVFDFSNEKKEGKQVRFIFDDRRTVPIPLGNKQMCLYLLVLLFTRYKKGVPLGRATKKKTKNLMDVEIVFNSIYNNVKSKADIDLYDGKGKLTNDIQRVAGKMKDIPTSYHVVISENKAIVNFPCMDIVYVKFNKNEKLLSDEIEKMKAKDCKMKFEDICCGIFH